MTTLVYQDDPESIAFIERRGLEIDGGGQLGRLDLTTPDVDDAAGEAGIEGVTIETLARPAGSRARDVRPRHAGSAGDPVPGE